VSNILSTDIFLPSAKVPGNRDDLYDVIKVAAVELSLYLKVKLQLNFTAGIFIALL